MKGGTANGAAIERTRLPPGKVRSFDEPAAAADNRGGERRRDDEQDRVNEETADKRTKYEAGGVAEIDPHASIV